MRSPAVEAIHTSLENAMRKLSHTSTPLLLLLLLTTWHSGNVCDGSILVNPNDTWVIEGQSTTLYCQFKVDPNMASSSCYWTRDEQVVEITLSQGVYEWIGDSQHGDCSFSIVEAELERDQAVWRCQLPAISTQSKADMSSPAKLTVYVPPSQPILYQLEQPTKLVGDRYSIWENETAVVTCGSYHGNPAPGLQWSFNGARIDATKDDTSPDDMRKATYKRLITLQKKFNKDDNGKILRCNLTHNSLNDTESIETQLDIQYSTTTVEILSPNYVVVDEGTGYSFVCKADGNPEAKCEWLYKKADATDWVIISETCQYEIESATLTDEGQYMCLAGNNEKMRPSPEIQFDLRDGSKNVVGIIAGVFGGVLVIAVIVLTVVVIRLRRRMKKKNLEELTRLPSMAELNRIVDSPSRGNTLVKDTYNVSRDTTYMVPSEVAPLRPPDYNDVGSFRIRNKNLPKLYKDDCRRSDESRRNTESNIYSEPHFYEEIIDRDSVKVNETDC